MAFATPYDDLIDLGKQLVDVTNHIKDFSPEGQIAQLLLAIEDVFEIQPRVARHKKRCLFGFVRENVNAVVSGAMIIVAC